MADYDVTLSESMMPDLLERPNALAQLVQTVIQQVLEAQVSEHVGADRYERTDDRAGYRNGYRERQLYTRVGPVTLRVPQTREGSFSSEIFSRYRRSEQAFVLGLMEMFVNGVSTRKVSEITEALVRHVVLEVDGEPLGHEPRWSRQRVPFAPPRRGLSVPHRRRAYSASRGAMIA